MAIRDILGLSDAEFPIRYLLSISKIPDSDIRRTVECHGPADGTERQTNLDQVSANLLVRTYMIADGHYLGHGRKRK